MEKDITTIGRSKLLMILFVLMITPFVTLAEDLALEKTGHVKGTIITSDGQPAALVTVTIKNINRTALTGEDGTFIIRNLKPGKYELLVALVGYNMQQQTFTIETGKTTDVSFTLTLTGKELQEVTVTSHRSRFGRSKTAYVARLPLRNIENIQVYNTITAELLKEQVITNFDDALKNAPGIDKLWSSTGRSGDGAAFFSLRGFSVQPSMINGVAGLSNGGLDPSNIESIEVIKGPSGTLFGSSLISFGGLININTKKPYDSTGGEISYTGGSFGLTRITADINTPLNKNKNVLFRVNGAYHYENSFQDAGFRRSFFIAPSLSYQVNNRLSFLLNTEFYNSESTSPAMLFLNRTRKLIATTPAELNVNYKRSFTSNDVTIKNSTFNIYGQMNYKLSSFWTSQTNVSSSSRKSDGYYQYVMYILPGDSLLNRYISDQYSISTTNNIQQNFIGDFRIGNMRNRIVVGIDYLQLVTNNNNSAYVLFDTLLARKPDTKYTNLSQSALDARFAQNTNPTKNIITSHTYSAYVSNVLNITPQLIAMLSLRADRFDNKGTYNLRTETTSGAFAQTALSPKLGVLYQLLPNKLSIFSNYMNGFRNVAAATQPDGTVSNFKPQQATQWEAGVKMELLDRKLIANISYYDIYVSNVTRPDPDKAGFTVQDGNASSKGFEADIIANPLTGLNIVAGYSHNKSLNEKTDPGSIGRRPVTAGPANLANLWMSYSAIRGTLKGWGLGFGGNYASENLVTNTLTTGVFTLPAYTVLNATIFYNADAFRFAVKVDNITDKQYWKGWTTVEPQRPRSVNASIAFRF